jgi:hypothetical protein
MSRAASFLGLASAVALVVGVAQAVILPEGNAMRQEAEAQAFVQTTGYTLVNVDTLSDKEYYSKNIFPDLHAAAMSMPDAGLDPVTKAVLQLDSREKPLPHARYRITYNMGYFPGAPEVQRTSVEVARFNMGPAVRAGLQGSVPAENLADPQAFGIGPHVSWRFVMAPRMGMTAEIIGASRKVVPSGLAGILDCLGTPCLSPANPEGPSGKWRTVAPPSVDRPTYRHRAGELERPPRVAQELLALAAPHGVEVAPYRPGSPRMVFVISLNVGGQEEQVHGLLHDAFVMDDAVSSVWTQRLQVSGVPVEFSQRLVPRKR